MEGHTNTGWNPDDVSPVKPSQAGNRNYNAADVVTNWVAQPQVKLNVTFNPATGVPTDLYVKGSWDNWATAIPLTYGSSSFTGVIGNGTTDVIYSNVEYKYYTTQYGAPENWESAEDGSNRSNRWSIFPQMNDEIARFTEAVTVNVNTIKDVEVKILRTPTGISVQFDGEADVELYGISGQLIDKTKVSNNYNKDLEKGAYIIRVNGIATKFVR